MAVGAPSCASPIGTPAASVRTDRFAPLGPVSGIRTGLGATERRALVIAPSQDKNDQSIRSSGRTPKSPWRQISWKTAAEAIGCARLSLRDSQEEEGGYEYVSDHGGKEGKAEARVEPAVLYQPLGETGIEGSKHEQPGQGGNTHSVSGDGCGDGGYCGGHWVKRSEKGHPHGEHIGEDAREEGEIGVCLGCGPSAAYHRVVGDPVAGISGHCSAIALVTRSRSVMVSAQTRS